MQPTEILIDLSKVTGLLLPVVSEPWVVECEGCFGCRKAAYASVHPGDIVLAGGEPYNVCHGTGTRPVRLVGMVRDIRFGIRNMGAGVAFPVFRLEWRDGSIDAGGEYQLAEKIVQAYRAGTLPPDLMASDDPKDWRLREVEVTDERD